MNGSAGDPSGSSEAKSWERSWSTDEMRQNAHAWNLAGDTGLLKYLQEFSQTVLAHTHTTEKALDSLAEEISTLTSDVNTTNNKFLCLANTQFVENRVYDDDDKETPQDEPVPKTQSKEETEAKMLQKVREALSLSVAVLDTMFEPVEIQASDSEGELETEQQGTKTLLLEPHNPYIHRPLPHLIGSEAFMSDDHIGLADSPSDEEEQPLKTGLDFEMDGSSDSDNDFTPIGSNKRKMDVYSSRSSLSTGPEQISQKIKPTDPTLGASDDALEPPSSVQKPVQDNLFATQLAAKLDKIAGPATSSNVAAKKNSSDNLFGGVLSENEDDGLFSGNSGLFSGRPRLFDDLEDTNNSLWGPDEVIAKNASTEREKVAQTSKIPTKSDNLFSSNGSDEEDSLFSFAKSGETVLPKPSPPLKKTDSQRPGIVSSTPDKGLEESSAKISGPISNFKDESRKSSTQVVEDLQDNAQSPIVPGVQRETPDKKLAGAVPMFGKANVLEGLKAKLPRRQSSSSSDSSSNDYAENSTVPPVGQTSDDVNNYDQEWNDSTNRIQNSQAVSQGFSSPAFHSSRLPNNENNKTKEVTSTISSKPTTSNDDIDDIFANKPSAFSPPFSEPISGGLFADVDDDEDDLFAVSPAPKRVEKKEISDNSEKHINNSLLKEVEKNKPANSNADAESAQSSKPPHSTIPPKSAPGKSFTHDIYSTVPPPLKSESKIKKPVSLFDDSDSGEDELLFSSASSAGSRRSQASTDILSASAASSIEKKSLSKKGLFDDDDALFGSTHNDPDIDIFGLSKSSAEAKPILGETKPLPDTRLFKEESSIPNRSNSTLQNSSVSNSRSSDSIGASKPENKSAFQDDLFAGDNSDKGDLVSTKPSLLKSKLFDSAEGDDVESDIFRDILVDSSVQNVDKVSSSASTIQPTKVDGSSSIEPRPLKASIAVENEIKSEEKQLPIEEKHIPNEKTNCEKSISVKNESSPQINAPIQHRKPEPPKTLNIRKETDPGLGLFDESNDEDDDLFGSSWKKETQKPAPLPEESIRPKTAAKPLTAVKPSTAPLSGTAVKNLDIPQASSEPSSKTVDVADGATLSVSKLRNSLLAGGNGQPPLKIDPRALLPGQKPPPRRTPPKEEEPEPEPTATSAPQAKEPPVRPSEHSVGFDQPTLINATLSSVNKDRAKLGVKRRPPSNKARREAARASQNLDHSDRDSPLSPDASSIWTDSIGGVNSNGNSNNSVLSPSTDEDDLFGVPQDLPAEYENPSSTSDIFSSPPILSPVVPVNNDTKPERSNFTDEVKEFQDSLQKNASLFLPPDDIEDDSLSEKLFDPVPGVKENTAVNTAPVVDSDPLVDTVPVVDTSAVVDSASEINSVSKIDTVPVVDTTPVVNTAPVAVASEKSPTIEDSPSLKTVPDPSAVLLQHSRTPPPDSPKSLRKDEGAAHAIDPLNKQERTSMDEESSLFGNDDVSDTEDDHSALFPFVKKKLESKQSSNQPLFSPAPILPSKSDKPSPKPDLGGLDQVEDNHLFSSTNLKPEISSKKAPTLQTKEVKTWNFSDEDDDDLFQTGTKTVQLKPSQKVFSTSKGKSASPEPFVSEKNTQAVKPSQPKANNGLFSDENDDDDLFSKPSPLLKSKVKETKSTKPSLFDDDDDDLFGAKQPKSFKTPKPIRSENVPGTSVQPQSSSKVKKENVNIFDDPLKAFEND